MYSVASNYIQVAPFFGTFLSKKWPISICGHLLSLSLSLNLRALSLSPHDPWDQPIISRDDETIGKATLPPGSVSLYDFTVCLEV